MEHSRQATWYCGRIECGLHGAIELECVLDEEELFYRMLLDHDEQNVNRTDGKGRCPDEQEVVRVAEKRTGWRE